MIFLSVILYYFLVSIWYFYSNTMGLFHTKSDKKSWKRLWDLEIFLTIFQILKITKPFLVGITWPAVDHCDMMSIVKRSIIENWSNNTSLKPACFFYCRDKVGQFCCVEDFEISRSSIVWPNTAITHTVPSRLQNATFMGRTWPDIYICLRS